MNRIHLGAALALLACTAGSSRADLVNMPQFSSYPSSYTPGTPFQFELIAPLTSNSGNSVGGINSYNIDLILTATTGNLDLTVSAAMPSANYIFSGYSSSFTTISASGPGTTQYSLQISDSIGVSNSVMTSSSNYIFAIVTVNPAADMTGNLNIAYSYSTYDSSNGTFTPTTVTVQEGDSVVQRPNAINLSQNPPSSPAPAPAGWALLGMGTLVLLARSRFGRGTGEPPVAPLTGLSPEDTVRA